MTPYYLLMPQMNLWWGRRVNEMALMARDKETGQSGGSGRSADTRAVDAHHYWAFLSYSHADNADADWLHQAIERFVMPKALVGRVTANGAVPKKLTPIFRDRHELAASSDLGGKIRAALKQSRFLIVLCSPAAAGSRWVNEEILTFKKLHGERRILAAIVGGEPWASEIAGREGEECFPPALREKFDRKGQATGKRAEPIAADLRAERDGREGGKLKLVAGMLGLGLDDLVRREQQRRQKRLKYVAAAALAGMTVTSGLAVFAFDKRDEARDQRREAEGLVGFMLGDLRDKLEPIGRLDALDAVGSRALKYFEQQDKAELSDAALAQRSKALNLLGQIATARGETEAALARYREAMRSTSELVERSPNDPQRLFDHAQNVFWMGELMRMRGRMGQAEAAYREYKSLADRMVASEPHNPKWRMEEVYAKENIGIVLDSQRRFAEAAREFDAALPTLRKLASKSPTNDAYQGELSTMLAWLADSRRNEGRLQLAINARQSQIDLLQSQLSSGKTDVQLQEQLAFAQQALALLLTDTGNVSASSKVLQSAIDITERLIAIEPQNARWRGLAAGIHLSLADTFLTLGRTTDAEQEAEAGCRLAAMLRTRDPNVASWRSSQTSCQLARSELALVNGSPPEALDWAAKALESARQERSFDSVKDRYRVAAAFRLIGDIHRRAGEKSDARQAWAAGLAALPASINERPREMDERVKLLRRLDRNDQARQLIERLQEMGFWSEH